MPYIKTEQRVAVDKELLNDGLGWTPQNAGELNYAVTCLIDNFLMQEGVSYASVNEMIGALECCKLELYRVMVGPYEDKKIRENGSVMQAQLPEGNY